MSIVTIGRIVSEKNLDRSCEVMFDGRTIGHLQIPVEGEPSLKMVEEAKNDDIDNAIRFVKEDGAADIFAFAYSKYDVVATKEKTTRILNKKLKKNTLFIPKDTGVLRIIKQPYSENVRRYISDNFPGATILNTLSEDDSLKLYSENKTSNEDQKKPA